MGRLFAIILLMGAGAVSAVEMKNLFDAEVPVESLAADVRNVAIGKALTEVLGRLVPAAELARPAVKGLLKNAAQYVQQFSYTVEETQTGEDAPGRVLAVRFDETLLTEALKANRLPFWRASRPETLVWLEVSREGSQALFSPETMPELGDAVRNGAAAVGLPLLMPLMDLTDQANLSAADLWNESSGRLRQASARYETQSTLAGRLFEAPDGRWRADWRHFWEDEEARWQTGPDDLSGVVRGGFAGVYDRLIARFAVKPPTGEPTALELGLTGIGGYGDYARVGAYLESVPGVESVFWQSLGPGTAVIELVFKGDAEAMRQILASGGVLEPSGLPVSGRLECRVLPEDLRRGAGR